MRVALMQGRRPEIGDRQRRVTLFAQPNQSPSREVRSGKLRGPPKKTGGRRAVVSRIDDDPQYQRSTGSSSAVADARRRASRRTLFTIDFSITVSLMWRPASLPLLLQPSTRFDLSSFSPPWTGFPSRSFPLPSLFSSVFLFAVGSGLTLHFHGRMFVSVSTVFFIYLFQYGLDWILLSTPPPPHPSLNWISFPISMDQL